MRLCEDTVLVYYDYVHGKVHWISTELEIKINEQDIHHFHFHDKFSTRTAPSIQQHHVPCECVIDSSQYACDGCGKSWNINKSAVSATRPEDQSYHLTTFDYCFVLFSSQNICRFDFSKYFFSLCTNKRIIKKYLKSRQLIQNGGNSFFPRNNHQDDEERQSCKSLA